MSSEMINSIANVVIALVIVFLAFRFLKGLKKKKTPFMLAQKERESKSCRVHDYEKFAGINICVECGFNPTVNSYFNVVRVKKQSAVNKTVNKLLDEKGTLTLDILSEYDLSVDKLKKINMRITIAGSKIDNEIVRITNKAIEESKDLEM